MAEEGGRKPEANPWSYNPTHLEMQHSEKINKEKRYYDIW